MKQHNETIEPKSVLKLLAKSLPYYLNAWHETALHSGMFGNINPQSFNMNEMGTSSPVIEYVVRPHINILTILAVYQAHSRAHEWENNLSSEELQMYINKGLIWLCETHITGSLDVDTFLERKRWGENWRSGLWAALMCLCTYLARKVIGDDLLKKIRRVIAFEADRFIDVLPPSGCDFDTKLEENAQDTMILAWAINFMPEHPHRKQWIDALNIWALNIATSIKDQGDHTEYLGKSISYWTITQTLFPDKTAENHGFFNPEILSYSIWIVLSMTAYKIFNNTIPSVLQRKVHEETYETYLRFFLPNGLFYSPSDSDIPYFIPHPFYLAWGLWYNDPTAHRLTNKIIQWMRNQYRYQVNPLVPWIPGFLAYYEGWELYFQSQVGFELALLSVVPFNSKPRPGHHSKISRNQNCSIIYPYVQTCFARNTRTTCSVAWKTADKHPVIGLNVHSYPELLIQFKANMLGIPNTDEKIKGWDVAFHNEYKRKNGFDTYGRINYFTADNCLLCHREVRTMVWAEEGIVVFDRIHADQDFYMYEQYLSPIYLVNDIWTNNKLQLLSGSLKETIYAENYKARHFHCPASWASIEDTFLLQLIWGHFKDLTYIHGNQRNAPRYWKNCRLDMLAIYQDPKNCKQGDIVYEIGFFAGAGKSLRPFKTAGIGGDFFKGLVIMDRKNTIGLD